jgi:hypothetical protein
MLEGSAREQSISIFSLIHTIVFLKGKTIVGLCVKSKEANDRFPCLQTRHSAIPAVFFTCCCCWISLQNVV